MLPVRAAPRREALGERAGCVAEEEEAEGPAEALGAFLAIDVRLCELLTGPGPGPNAG